MKLSLLALFLCLSWATQIHTQDTSVTPSTSLPTTSTPTTISPTTKAPTTVKPTTTKAPTTAKPTTTKAPTTAKPTTTKAPTTAKPTTTKAPTTAKPTTTKAPTTAEPTSTKAPTTAKPTTTKAPTTVKPATTQTPTTVKPDTTTTPPTTQAPSDENDLFPKDELDQFTADCQKAIASINDQYKQCKRNVQFPDENSDTAASRLDRVCAAVSGCYQMSLTATSTLNAACKSDILKYTDDWTKAAKSIDRFTTLGKKASGYCSKNKNGDYCFLQVLANIKPTNNDFDLKNLNKSNMAAVCDPCFAASVRVAVNAEKVNDILADVSLACTMNPVTNSYCLSEAVDKFSWLPKGASKTITLPENFGSNAGNYCSNPCFKKMLARIDLRFADQLARLCADSTNGGVCMSTFDKVKAACFPDGSWKLEENENFFPSNCSEKCAAVWKEVTKVPDCCLATTLKALGAPVNSSSFRGFHAKCVAGATVPDVKPDSCAIPKAALIERSFLFPNINYSKYLEKKEDMNKALVKDLAINLGLPEQAVRVFKTRQGSLILTVELEAPTLRDAKAVDTLAPETMTFENTYEVASQSGVLADPTLDVGAYAAPDVTTTSSSLNAGAVAAIVIGTIVGVLLIVIVIIFLFRRSSDSSQRRMEPMLH